MCKHQLSLVTCDQKLGFVFFIKVEKHLHFLLLLWTKMQEEKGHAYLKLEKHALNLLVAGPVLWLVGSIHNACQIYERADGHVQILQQCVYIPFFIGSFSLMLSAILNHVEQSRSTHHGIHLLVSSL
ncbi:hypothetical protein Lalb_Chr08g0240551 [Lupinus albus]|uniref:Uncharacterized protein n=1 Tax=Lupinus albus TaxID=3870 RepID=A0A6A4Q4M0_LUPAL|nr:hypothetical protein Lalb_Chr08g0240551 [Lupinus albus]